MVASARILDKLNTTVTPPKNSLYELHTPTRVCQIRKLINANWEGETGINVKHKHLLQETQEGRPGKDGKALREY